MIDKKKATDIVNNMTMPELVELYNSVVLDRRFFPNGDIFNICDRAICNRVLRSIDPMTLMAIIDNNYDARDIHYSCYDEWRQLDEDNCKFYSFDCAADLFDLYGIDTFVEAYMETH